jgi:hypothetical protein
MLDYIHLSQTTLCDVPCAWIETDDFMQNTCVERRAYFQIVRCPRDFGAYLDFRFVQLRKRWLAPFLFRHRRSLRFIFIVVTTKLSWLLGYF